MHDGPEISVIVPCHNERDNLEPLARALGEALEPLGRPYEIIITDDASTDDSWSVLQRLTAADRRIRAQRFAAQGGQSAALWAGMRAARGRILVTLDADLQNPPAEIPRFLTALRDADCVCGNRVAARARGDNWLRRVSANIANSVRNKVSGETIVDAGCCFRALRRECIANLKFFQGAHRFLPTLIKMEGFRVAEIAIGHHPRAAGRSHYGIGNRLARTFVDLLAVRWMKKRSIRYRIEESVNG
jgi:glycosyltransferase involved in cell wall biosynthesis